MNTPTHVPPGFRFHPTDEELVDYYLRRKVAARRIDLDVIKDIDLYKIEPWDLREVCRIGTEEQNEWYFFSHKDKKYPTGTRTNRATAAGFWKATGRDKAIYCKHELVGMRKTLVFYKGRAPNGQKSDWIMHEYRHENGSPREEGWVVCRVFKKRIPAMNRGTKRDYSFWYDEHVSSFMPDHFLQLPNLESSKIPHSTGSGLIPSFGPPNPANQGNTFLHGLGFEPDIHQTLVDHNFPPVFRNGAGNQVSDWRAVHQFVASQLSHEEISKGNDDYFTSRELGLVAKNDSNSSSSSSQIDLWK